MEAVAEKRLVSWIVDNIKPKPIKTGSEWADNYFVLSPEYSYLPGKIKLRPYQREILDVMTDYKHQFVIIMKSTRVGYTVLLDIVQAYFIEERPSSILHAQPNDSEIKGYVEDHLEPMIRDNKNLRRLVFDETKTRNKRDKAVKKFFPGGTWEGIGAESAKNFNRRTVKVAIGDEVDAWKAEVGGTGDILMTFFRRTTDFWDRKNIIGGKPVGKPFNGDELDGVSKIHYWFLKGDQRHRYLPCPKCNHYQKFEFEDMRWEKEVDKDGKIIKEYPETAHFICKKCGFKIEDKHKKEMDAKGKWVAENPNSNIVSFYIWAGLSYSPNVTWADIAREYIEAKSNPLKLKAFYNEVLGLPYEEAYEEVDIDRLLKRREEYKAEVPNEVLVLTFGADIQDDRIEVEVVGWGAKEESWSIDYKIFYGDTSKTDVWEQLDSYLVKVWHREDGGKMKVFCGGIDTQGHRTKQAYEFCKSRFSRRVFAFKGSNQLGIPIAPRRASRRNKANVPLFSIGVNTAKDVIFSYIQTDTPGAGYMHFPDNPMYNEDYFLQLTAERRNAEGRWEKIRKRNEALDVRVYAYSSLFVASIDLELLALRKTPLGLVYSNKTKREVRDENSKEKELGSYLDEF